MINGKNPLFKYVMKENKEDVFHSSAYGKAQNGASMGAASTQSFAERRRIEQNRQVVKGYGHSGLLNQASANGPRAKVYVAPPSGGSAGPISKSPGNFGKK